MNALAAKGIWNVIRGKMMQNFAWLIQDERQFIEGKRAELTGRIQQRAAQIRAQADRTSHQT